MSKVCLICGRPIKNSSKEYHKTCCFNLFKCQNFSIDTLTNENFDSIAVTNLKEGNAITGVQKKITFSPAALKKQIRLIF